MNDCLFCKIVAGQIPSEKLYEDDTVVAFEDISPQAPVHFLVIPKQHISTTNDLDEEHESIVGKMLLTASRIAQEKGIAESGYRMAINCNRDGCQSVYHIHLHLLGGRAMTWPPG